MSEAQARNRDVVRAYFAALNRGDADAFAETHDPRGRSHAAAPFDLSEWTPDGKPFGPAEARETLSWLRTGSPDLHAEIVRDDLRAMIQAGAVTPPEQPTG